MSIVNPDEQNSRKVLVGIAILLCALTLLLSCVLLSVSSLLIFRGNKNETNNQVANLPLKSSSAELKPNPTQPKETIEQENSAAKSEESANSNATVKPIPNASLSSDAKETANVSGDSRDKAKSEKQRSPARPSDPYRDILTVDKIKKLLTVPANPRSDILNRSVADHEKPSGIQPEIKIEEQAATFEGFKYQFPAGASHNYKVEIATTAHGKTAITRNGVIEIKVIGTGANADPIMGFDASVEDGVRSGFLVSSNGHMLCAGLDLRNANRIVVRFQKGVFDASFVAEDKELGLTLIKLHAPNLEVPFFAPRNSFLAGDRCWVADHHPISKDMLIGLEHTAIQTSENGSNAANQSFTLHNGYRVDLVGEPVMDQAGQVVGWVSKKGTKFRNGDAATLAPIETARTLLAENGIELQARPDRAPMMNASLKTYIVDHTALVSVLGNSGEIQAGNETYGKVSYGASAGQLSLPSVRATLQDMFRDAGQYSLTANGEIAGFFGDVNDSHYGYGIGRLGFRVYHRFPASTKDEWEIHQDETVPIRKSEYPPGSRPEKSLPLNSQRELPVSRVRQYKLLEKTPDQFTLDFVETVTSKGGGQPPAYEMKLKGKLVYDLKSKMLSSETSQGHLRTVVDGEEFTTLLTIKIKTDETRKSGEQHTTDWVSYRSVKKIEYELTQDESVQLWESIKQTGTSGRFSPEPWRKLIHANLPPKLHPEVAGEAKKLLDESKRKSFELTGLEILQIIARHCPPEEFESIFPQANRLVVDDRERAKLDRVILERRTPESARYFLKCLKSAALSPDRDHSYGSLLSELAQEWGTDLGSVVADQLLETNSVKFQQKLLEIYQHIATDSGVRHLKENSVNIFRENHWYLGQVERSAKAY